MYPGPSEDLKLVLPERYIGRKSKRNEHPNFLQADSYCVRGGIGRVDDSLACQYAEPQKKKWCWEASDNPGETCISQMKLGGIRNNIAELCNSESPKKRGRRGMKDRYTKVILEVLDVDPDIKPEDGLVKVKERLTYLGEDASSFPTDKQIKSKISNLKHQIKRNREAIYLTTNEINRYMMPSFKLPEVYGEESECLKIQECDQFPLSFVDNEYLAEFGDLEIPF